MLIYQLYKKNVPRQVGAALSENGSRGFYKLLRCA